MRISTKTIINGAIGCLTSMAPYCVVPGVEEITKAILSACYDKQDDDFKSKNPKDIGMYLFMLVEFEDLKAINKFIKETLMSIHEFKMLNVSPVRQKQGFTYETQENEMVFVGRGIADVKEEHEFVDLCAAIRNIARQIWYTAEDNNDCFLCKHAKYYGSYDAGDNEFCKYCINNFNNAVKSYYESHPWSLLPRNSKEYQELVEQGLIKGMYL